MLLYAFKYSYPILITFKKICLTLIWDLISRAWVLMMTEEQKQDVVAATRSPHSSTRSSPSTNMTCYRCNIKGHLTKDCQKHETQCYRSGERGHWARNSSGNGQGENAWGIYVDGTQCLVLIDTGCLRTIVDADQCWSWRKAGVDVETIGGTSCASCSVGVVSISTDEGNSAKIDVLVVCGKPLGFDLLLGIDAIKTLGGIVVGSTGSVQLRDRRTTRCAAISINEPNFTATFDHHSRMWTVSWKWSEDHAPERLHNEVSDYPVAAEIQNEYTQELCTWVGYGWLVPYPEDNLGPPKGLILLMAALQQNKTKVHPVTDYWELNHHMEALTANADVWRQKGANVCLLDLRRVYLQICDHDTLWPYQTVKINGKRYCLIRLGFGLNVVPLIMKAIVSVVLSQEETVGCTAFAYIEDIYVNEDVVPMTYVREDLAQFGLKYKDPKWLEDGTWVLGLAVGMEHGELRWKQGSIVPEVPSVITWRTVFSLCGRLVRHLLVCSCLCVTCGILKRRANSVTKGWDDEAKDTVLQRMMFETIESVQQDDLAHGDWCVNSKELNL